MTLTPSRSNSYPIILFSEQEAWSTWLDQNHSSVPGVWLQLAKKNAGLTSLSYEEAVEVALCYGWIDGQARRYDASSWLQKFTPRGRKSLWSKINCERAEALVHGGFMKPAGFMAIEAAKRDGRWERAYDAPSTATIPSDFQAALDEHPEASAFFETLKRTQRYAFLRRIQTAVKAETRARRIEQFIGMLERQETFKQ